MQKEIEINKNFDEMNKSFLSSKKPYQLASIATAFLIGGVIMVFLRPMLGTTICSYLSLVFVMPFGFLGMYERHGLDFITYMKIRRRERLNGKLYYDSNPVREMGGKNNA